MTARWWSQPVAPDGSIAAEGIEKQMGAPRLDPLTVLARESAQNSWDARRQDTQVDFRMRLSRPTVEVRTAWRELVTPQTHGSPGLNLARCLDDPDSIFLTISDSGTTGLGGPLRADHVAPGPADFVNLVRNIGEQRAKPLGGGTYGFGKGVLYKSSSIGTVFIRTRCMWDGRTQTRLIGTSLGPSFVANDRRYTGRHWWAQVASDNCPDPLVDEDADRLAAALGFPDRAPTDLGTDIVILGVKLGASYDDETETEHDRDLDDAGEYLASAMLWNLWPLLLHGSGDRAPMRCSVSVEARSIDLPDPTEVVRLRPFIDAYRAVRGPEPEILERKSPRTSLGGFAVQVHLAPTRSHWTDVAVPFEGPAHHCVLMRQAGLVVCYRAGPVHPDASVQYGGVFRSLPEVDDAFAGAEPPTHDDWVADEAKGREARSWVRTALKRVDERLRLIAAEAPTGGLDGAAQPPLGALSSRLSSLIPSTMGTGATRVGSGARPSGGRSDRPTVRITGSPRLVIRHGAPLITAFLLADQSTEEMDVCVTATVALDTGEESEPPAGADTPQVLEAVSDDGTQRREGGRLVLAPTDPRRWTVLVRPVAQASTRIRATVLGGDRDS